MQLSCKAKVAGAAARADARAAFVRPAIRSTPAPCRRSSARAQASSAPVTTTTGSKSMLKSAIIYTDEAEYVPPFKFSKDELIVMATEVINTRFGCDKPELLSEDFLFRFPVVSLDKKRFTTAFASFKADEAFPGFTNMYYGFHMDPVVPGKLWFQTQGRGNHTGRFGGALSNIEPTGKEVIIPPQALSFTFNEQGQVTKFTGGYVTDRTIGNTGGLGGVYGLLYAIGHPFPFPEAQPWEPSWQYQAFQFLGSLTQGGQR